MQEIPKESPGYTPIPSEFDWRIDLQVCSQGREISFCAWRPHSTGTVTTSMYIVPNTLYGLQEGLRNLTDNIIKANAEFFQ